MKAVNLLPSDLRGAGKPAPAAVTPGAQAAGRAGAFAVLGVLAFSVVALAAYVLASNTVKDRQAHLDQVTAQAASVTQRAAKLKPYADFEAAALMRMETVKNLADGRFGWEQALRDLARAVPADVTLTSLSGSISNSSGASGGGAGGSAASDPLRSAISAPAISLQGCSTGQRGVAELMTRLRAIRGVTRVSLSKSERPDASSTTAPTGGSGTTGIQCKGKRPPTFSVVVFFEHASVPATATDVTTSTTASATTTTGSGTASATPTPAATPASTTTG
jgi:Tfp pilus assembly protein PilN